MREQKRLIQRGDWDVLVLLDACRYDYFKNIYPHYLTGNILKVKSAGSCTAEWLAKTFPDYRDDIVYVSANPLVGNHGLTIQQIFPSSEYTWKATESFSKIVDVWDDSFDTDLGTVPPDKVAKSTRKARMLYPKKRIVSHFMQPHAPYLGSDLPSVGQFHAIDSVEKEKEPNSGLKEIFLKYIGGLASKAVGPALIHKIKKFLHINKPPFLERLAEEYGEKNLRVAYRKNLEITFKEIRKLVKRLPGKIVVTSDHGEMLGEAGIYAHPGKLKHPILTVVPWLTVSGLGGSSK